MHLWTAIVLQCLTVDALAYYTFAGSNSDLVVHPLRNSSRVTGDIYEHCEFEHEGVVSKRNECVGEAVKIMITFLSSAGSAHHEGEEAVVLNNNGVGNEVLQDVAERSTVTTALDTAASPNNAELQMERGVGKREGLLESFNKRLIRRSGGRQEIRAVGFDHSATDSNAGLTVLTNVQSGDTALHVHTNASHATAEFKKYLSPALDERATESTQGMKFKGMQGFKMMVRWVDTDFGLDGLEATLLQFVSGHIGPATPTPWAPTYLASDAWAFAMCGQTDGQANDQMILQGKLVSLDENAGVNFEDDELVNCNMFKKPQ
jgi:hypothetical protein